MKAEGYDLVVYCDNGCKDGYNLLSGSFCAPSKREAYKSARKAGWQLGKTDLCPFCNPKCEKTRKAP